MSIRVRFAPSPTGMLHVGGARTALYDWLLARKYNGVFVLRIEDTDQTRYNPEAVTNIYQALEYLEMLPDEGPNGEELIKLGVNNSDAVKWSRGGEYGPYTQSLRSHIYKDFAEDLIDMDQAYYVFSDELDEDNPKFSEASKLMNLNTWREATPSIWKPKLDRGDSYHIRLKLPRQGTITCQDSIRGKVVFKCNKLKDPVILKTNGMATYHLASVIDDSLMKISHVLRGEEWLSSYPIHHYLYQLLGQPMPIFFHLPIILNPVGKGKMSKRSITVGDQVIPTSVTDYDKLGYVPEALKNYMALLGWSSGFDRELFSTEELIDQFTPYDIGRTGARWDIKKLQRMNQWHIKNMDLDTFVRRYVRYEENKSKTA